MPELPEVETIARRLRPALAGSRVLSARVFWARALARPEMDEFHQRITGQRIEAVTRRAKYLHLRLSNGHLLIHLRMSGDLLLRPSPCDRAPHDRLHLYLDCNETLAFHDTRKFGRIWLVDNAQEVLAGLGPEPFAEDFTPEAFHHRLLARRRQLKPLLLEQSFLAGLGNIYSDEALHLAGLHPLRQSDTISSAEARKLLETIRAVLQAGIENNGASIDWVYRGGNFQNYFRVYGRAGQPCPKCAAPIQRMVIGQRSAHYCPVCQVLE